MQTETMTATASKACCGVSARRNVSELFERGFRRNRAAPLPIRGPQCTDADGHAACFSIAVSRATISSVGFHASSCATLIAYCEYIAETVPPSSFETANALTAAQLVEAVAGVPALKHERAVLAIAAFRAALAVCVLA